MKVFKNSPITEETGYSRNLYYAIALSQIFSYSVHYVENYGEMNKFYFCMNDEKKYITIKGIYNDLKSMLKIECPNINLSNSIKINNLSLDKESMTLDQKIIKKDKDFIYKNALKYTTDENKMYISRKYIIDTEFSKRPFVQRKLYFNKDKVTTAIDVDNLNEEIRIKNFTKDPFSCAFGINEHPSWTQYNEFLKDRCIPKTRYGIKYFLLENGIESYDPEEIIKITHATTTDDKEWLLSEKEVEL